MIRRKKNCVLFCLGLIFGLYIGLIIIHVIRGCSKLKVVSKIRSISIPEMTRNHNDTDDDLDENDEFLFIGVMTDRKYLETRARAIHMTWGRQIPGKLVFFIGEGEPYRGDLNVVELKGVSENSYPPQKKSFAMLQYMGKYYVHRYKDVDQRAILLSCFISAATYMLATSTHAQHKWLMRADDDVYIKPDYLRRFLKGINDTHVRYIGQPGYGRDNEKGRLGLSKAFCMGGPGVIMSAALLKAVLPNLPLCVNDVETSHEDTELGRCIAQSVGLPCTQAYEMQYLFYQNYQELHLPNSSFKKELGQSELRAITLHPVKEVSYVFRLDNFIKSRRLQILEEKRRRLKIKTQMILTESPRLKKFLHTLESNLRKSKPLKRTRKRLTNLDNITSLPWGRSGSHPIHYWDCLKGTTIHSPRLVSAKMIFPARHRGRLDIKDNITQTIEDYLRITLLHHKDGTKPYDSFKFSFFQYQQLAPDKGILGQVFVNSKQGKKLSSRPYLYRVPFEKDVDFREADQTEKSSYLWNDRIVVIMTVFRRSEVYQNFLIMFGKAASGQLELRIVVFKDPEKQHLIITNATRKFQAANPSLKIELIYSLGDFNRGKGLMDGLNGVSNSSLVLFMDSDMTFSSRFLQRVSANTIRGQQAFFPIYFTHFDPSVTCYKKKYCRVQMESREEDVGFWRSFSYGIASIYKSDAIRCGGFRTNITGWGLEDVELYENCLKTGLVTMRVIDPGIVHRYHARECDETLPVTQLESCRLSGAKMMGSVKNLGVVLDDMGIL